MRSRILTEAGISLGLVVWLLAATLLPFHLAIGGAGWPALLAYVVIAGGLFAVGNAVLGMSYLCNMRDISGTGLMRAIGLAFPASILFALGTWLAPAADHMGTHVCRMGGFVSAESKGIGPKINLDPDVDCLPVAAHT